LAFAIPQSSGHRTTAWSPAETPILTCPSVIFASFQCFAPSHDRYLRCESVSKEYVPEIAQVLTREKKDRLVREFGFTPPGSSKNFSRKIEIQNSFDLAYVARLAFRILRDVYDVTDFGLAEFKSSLGARVSLRPERIELASAS
jgi:hypothetical protein